MNRREFLQNMWWINAAVLAACAGIGRTPEPTADADLQKSLDLASVEANAFIKNFEDFANEDFGGDKEQALHDTVNKLKRRIENIIPGINQDETEQLFANKTFLFSGEDGPKINNKYDALLRWALHTNGKVVIWKNGYTEASGIHAVEWFFGGLPRSQKDAGFLNTVYNTNGDKAINILNQGFSVFVQNTDTLKAQVIWQHHYAFAQMLGRLVGLDAKKDNLPEANLIGAASGSVYAELLRRRKIILETAGALYKESRLGEMMGHLVNTSGLEPGSLQYNKRLADGFNYLSDGLTACEVGIVSPMAVADRFDEKFYTGASKRG